MGLVEMGSYLFSFCGKGLISRHLRSKIQARAPRSSPYFSYRILRDPPGRVKTEFGELLLTPVTMGPVLVDYAIERHITPRDQKKPMTSKEVAAVGPHTGGRQHFDLRFRDPETREVHAFALTTGFPGQGKKVMVIKVDDRHGHKHLINPGTPLSRGRVLIPEGYGRGHSKLMAFGKTFIWSGADNSFHIWIPPVEIDGQRIGGGFSIIQPEGWRGGTPRQYLMQPLKVKEVPLRPRPFDAKDISGDKTRLKAYIKDPGWMAEWKKDGAFYTIEVIPRKDHEYANVMVISRREGVDGQGIDRSMNLSHIKFAKWPEYALGRQIRIEAHSEVKGTYKSQHGRTGAILTMDPASAMLEQQSHGRLRLSVIGIKGEGDYRAQRALALKLKEDVIYVDPTTGKTIHPLSVAPAAITPAGKAKFVKSLRERRAEGVIFRKVNEPDTVVKFIFRGRTIDKQIVGIEMMVTIQPKYMKDGRVIAAQTFILRDGSRAVIRDPEGGPGSTDRLRLDVGANPAKYIGAFVELKPRQANRSSTAQIHRLRLDKGSHT